MADEVVSQQKSGPKTHWSMQTAIAVMVAGGALILIAWFVPVEEGSGRGVLEPRPRRSPDGKCIPARTRRSYGLGH